MFFKFDTGFFNPRIFIFENNNYLIFKRKLFKGKQLIFEFESHEAIIYEIEDIFMKKKLKYIISKVINEYNKILIIGRKNKNSINFGLNMKEYDKELFKKLTKAAIELI